MGENKVSKFEVITGRLSMTMTCNFNKTDKKGNRNLFH